MQNLGEMGQNKTIYLISNTKALEEISALRGSSFLVEFSSYLLLDCSTTKFGAFLRGSFFYSMLIIIFVKLRLESHREPRNEIELLTPAESPAEFKLGTFQFLWQHLNPLGHSKPNIGVAMRSYLDREKS